MTDVRTETTEKVIYVERQKEPTSFSVERKIPIAFIFAICVQAAGLVYFAAQTSFTLADHARRLAISEARSDEQGKQLNGLVLDVTQRLVRIEARLQVQQTQPPRERE
ncbi:MAG: hypothetical protein DI601_00295 [Azospirillum brasilense]|nr:MAG: hypothetical protein DI601_00295 [Azospirillum brasilense]